MASMNKQWQKIQRTDWVQEYFMIGEFIQSDNWQRSSPSFYPRNYPYLKDCIEFCGNQYGRDIKNEIRVTEITHGTSCEKMLSIIKDGGFRPATKDIPGIGHMGLVWFGLKIEETEIDCVKKNYQRSAQDLLQCGVPTSTVDSVVSHFASTAPFQPMSRYGNFKFTLNIEEVLREYKMQFGNGRLEMRKLGTFAYKMETMHVILVCPPGTNITDQCPLFFGDPVIQPDDEIFKEWTWRPHSTGDHGFSVIPATDSVIPKYNVITAGKRWEHVVFAFYVPLGRCLKIDNLNDHVSLCLWQHMDHSVSGVNEAINIMLSFITHEEEQLIREAQAKMLERMISEYNNEMHLYEKTTSGLKKGDLFINLEWAQKMLRDLLPIEYNRLF